MMTATYERVVCEGFAGSSRRFKVGCGHWVGRGEEAIHCYRDDQAARVTMCSACGRAWIKRARAVPVISVTERR